MAINNINASTIAFSTVASVTAINTQTGSTYTAVLSDAAACVLMNNSSANTFQVPTNASVAFPVGTSLNVVQYGTGATTIQAANSGTTTIVCLSAANTVVAAPIFRGRYSAATLLKVATDTWLCVGDVY